MIRKNILFVLLTILSLTVFTSCDDNLVEPINLEETSVKDENIAQMRAPNCIVDGDNWDDIELGIGEERTFSVVPHIGATYEWTATTIFGQISFVGGTTGPSVTIKGVKKGSVQMTVKISYSATSYCTISDLFTVVDGDGGDGNPPVCIPTGELEIKVKTLNWHDGVACPDTQMDFEVLRNGQSCGATYTWTVMGATHLLTYNQGRSIRIRTTHKENHNVTIRVTDSNGDTEQISAWTDGSTCSPGGGMN